VSERDRDKRRARRLEKTKKKRAAASRAGKDGPLGSADTARGRTWPTGECFVSDGWDEPGARVHAVLSRSNAAGAAVVAVFELDRSGPGLVAARARGGLTAEQVSGECARVSEQAGGATLVEAAPGLLAALVLDARRHGSDPSPRGAADALALLEGIAPMALEVPFGLGAEAKPEPVPDGWLTSLRKRLFG
jgi:hypothetical protein